MYNLEDIIKEKKNIIERLNIEINLFKEKINVLINIIEEKEEITKYFNEIFKRYDFNLQNIENTTIEKEEFIKSLN